MTQWQKENKDKQQSAKHNTEHYRSRNTAGWTQVLRKGLWHHSCYSCYKPS